MQRVCERGELFRTLFKRARHLVTLPFQPRDLLIEPRDLVLRVRAGWVGVDTPSEGRVLLLLLALRARLLEHIP